MNDAKQKAHWSSITNPYEALEELVEHSMYLGSDPYYRDMNDALLEMATRITRPQLPWAPDNTADHRAVFPEFEYFIESTSYGFELYYPEPDFRCETFETLELAKLAAQVDYNARTPR